jgi:ubiquinone/menaquinone biosynthesis C-methylase UbiE
MEKQTISTAALKGAESYEDFIVPGVFRNFTPILLNRLAPQPGERVLDLACGTGIVARSILPLVKPGGSVSALDANASFLEVARTRFPEMRNEIDWQEGWAEALPYADGEFDLVLCQQGFQWFKDRPVAVREIHRVLREQGRVGIEVWQSFEQQTAYRTFYEAMANVLHVPVREIVMTFSAGEENTLCGLFEEAGFQQVHVEAVSANTRFPDPDEFVRLWFTGLASMIPAFTELNSDQQARLVKDLSGKVAGLIQDHTTRGVLSLPLQAYILTAFRSHRTTK